MKYTLAALSPLFFLLAVFYDARQVAADNWEARVYDTALPVRLVAVDKARQSFMFFEKKSPLTLKLQYPCSTGQIHGDKLTVGDKRTPEGIYFVEYKIANGLDFREYGGIAYTLNYPNPVDRLRGKSGHGIWIHSKGQNIVPNDTRGCVAIDLKNIEVVGPEMPAGTAVVLAERIPDDAFLVRDPGIARKLREQMHLWTQAWANRSPELFKFYNEEAYSKSMPETFAAFKLNKERLFRMLPWISIYNREIFVLEGPGYWVTWSEQYYRAPNLSTEGVRRLYWQREKDGRFRIIGMEWTPRDVGLHADYLKGALALAPGAAATAPERPRSVALSEIPAPPPVSMPEDSPPNAPAPAPLPEGRKDPAPPKAMPPVAAPKLPDMTVAALPAPVPGKEPVALGPAMQNQNHESARPEPAPVKPEASLERPAPVQPAPVQVKVTAQNNVPALEQNNAAAPAEADKDVVLDARAKAALQKRMNKWSEAWAGKSSAFFDFYDQEAYGKAMKGESFKALKADMAKRFRAPWIHIVSRPVSVEIEPGRGYITTKCEQYMRMPRQAAAEGVRKLYWSQGKDGEYRIIGSDWASANLGMQADYLEKIAPQVSDFIESWRTGWQAGDLKAYESCYAPNARQGARQGLAGIIEHKRGIWAKASPKEVELGGTRILLDPKGLRVDMTQVYRDSLGFQDKGLKSIVLEPVGASWRIIAEDWTALPAQ